MPRWLMDRRHGLVTVTSFVLSWGVVLAIWAASGHFAFAFHGTVDWPFRTGPSDNSVSAPAWSFYVAAPSIVVWVAFMARYEQAWINEHAAERHEGHEDDSTTRG